MRVRYEAYTWQGKRIIGVLEAESEEEAYRTFQGDQLVPARIREVRPRRSLVEIAPWLFQPKDQVIIDFTRQLATLLRGGIPL